MMTAPFIEAVVRQSVRPRRVCERKQERVTLRPVRVRPSHSALAVLALQTPLSALFQIFRESFTR